MILLLALLLPHDESVSSSRWELRGGELRGVLTIRLEDLAALAPIDADRDGKVDPAELESITPALARYFADRFRISNEAVACTLLLPAAPLEMSAGRTPVMFEARHRLSQAPLRIRCDLFREHVPAARHVAEFPGGATLILDAHRPEAEWNPLPAGTSRAGWAVLAVGAAALAVAILRTRTG